MHNYDRTDLFPGEYENEASGSIGAGFEPLISVIIPAYNICNELPSCLDSVLRQTLANIEIIVVNDGSTDDTAAVTEHYASQDPRVIAIHQENSGVTNARLAGVRASRGQWIAFVDGDDQVDSDMFSHLLENAEKYGADISHCGYRKISPNRIDYYYNTGKILEQDHEIALKDLLSAEFIEPALCNKLYKRSLFHKLLAKPLMDPNIRNYEDMLMNFFLFQESSKAIYEDFCPYQYIFRADSASTAKPNRYKLLGPLQVFKIIRSHLAEDPLLKDHVEVRLFSYLVTLSTLSSKDNKDLICPIRKDARKELRSMLRSMKKNCLCSRKLYLKGLWAGYLPASYSLVHSLVR